jgi:hypothetical protein
MLKYGKTYLTIVFLGFWAWSHSMDLFTGTTIIAVTIVTEFYYLLSFSVVVFFVFLHIGSSPASITNLLNRLAVLTADIERHTHQRRDKVTHSRLF